MQEQHLQTATTTSSRQMDLPVYIRLRDERFHATCMNTSFPNNVTSKVVLDFISVHLSTWYMARPKLDERLQHTHRYEVHKLVIKSHRSQSGPFDGR